MKHRKPMFYVVWAAVVLLLILHQDNWLWDNSTLVFGFLPITLLFHMGISIAATIVWLLATRYAWPIENPVTENPAIGNPTINDPISMHSATSSATRDGGIS